jgi:rod shape-determining protein MreD
VRGLISFVLVAITVVVQLTIMDRIAFPGGAGPDLVLLMVAALALAGGPMAGVLIGFWAGLALDVAPPGSHFTGQNALVFCLVGYACGLLADDASGDAEQGHTALFEILVMAAAAVCGEALAALLGVMLSDPRVTWPAITRVLPAAMIYDVLLCPFVLYAAAAALRLAGPREEGRIGWSASQARARTPAPGANQGAIRQLAGGNSPRLRLSDRDPGSIGGLRGPGAGRPAPRRERQLKLGRAGPPTVGLRGGLGTAAAQGGLSTGSSKLRFGGRRREGVLGGSLLGGASPGGSALRGSALRGSALRGSALRGSALRGPALRGPALGSPGLGASRFGSSSMGRSLLGGSVFSRSSSPRGLSSPLGRSSSWFGRGAVFGRPAPLGRSSPLRHRANSMRSAGGGLAGPRFARGGSLARLTGALRQSAGPKSPGRGWLRGASSRASSLSRSSLGGKSLGGSSLSRGTFGRGRFGRGTLGRGSLGRGTLGRGSIRRASLGRGSLSRGWAGSRAPRLKAGRTGRSGRSGRFGVARLRLTRPKAKRTWRTGGYR